MPKSTKETSENSKNLTSKKVTKSKKVASKTTTKAISTASKSKKATKSNAKKATSSKKVSNTKTPIKKANNSKKLKNINILEYYDLPYRYNKTVVKILAQTPKTLFVYWDISDEDRKNYINEYGENFFDNTKPVLIIHNLTMNYTFEIEINDFANCWYFNVNDDKCEYSIELGRRPKSNTLSIPNNYLYIASSNKIESPNGHILFEKNQNTLYYRNVKTNEVTSKNIANLEFIKYFGRIYNIYDMYKKIYKEDEFISINNPTSH